MWILVLKSRAVDPDSLNPGPYTEPNPAFQVNPDRIRIQDFYDQKLKKKNTADKFFFSFFDPKLQEQPSVLKREHPALQNMKFLTFFLFLFVIFALLDPDTDPLT